MSPEELLLVALKNAEHITWCEECERVFDARSGCEADIRHDERARLREKVEAMRVGGVHPTAWFTGYAEAVRQVLALLAEPGDVDGEPRT